VRLVKTGGGGAFFFSLPNYSGLAFDFIISGKPKP